MKTLPLLVILILLVVAILGSGWERGESPKMQEGVTTNLSDTEAPALSEISISSWLAYWDEEETLQGLRRTAPYLDGISPIWYRIMPDGSLGTYPVANREAIRKIAREENLTITPMIGDDFDHTRVRLLLTDAGDQQQFREQLLSEALAQGYHGWELEIETIEAADRDDYTKFVAALARDLHRHNLTLTVTVYAKDRDRPFSAAAAHDYQALGRIADRIQLMTHSYYNDDTGPGGQAPRDWYRAVLRYAIANVPPEKIVVGLSTHGNEWSEETYINSYTFQEVISRLARLKPQISYDQLQSSAVATFRIRDEQRSLWFEDTITILEKIRLAQQEFSLPRFILWRVGAEDPKLWENLLSSSIPESGIADDYSAQPTIR